MVGVEIGHIRHERAKPLVLGVGHIAAGGAFQFAKIQAERFLLLIGHRLAAKHQNGMFLEGGPHRRIGGIIRRDIL